MLTKATEFAGRPQDLFVNDVTKSKGRPDILHHVRNYVQLIFTKKKQQKPASTCVNIFQFLSANTANEKCNMLHYY